jgi:hypothetical protein
MENIFWFDPQDEHNGDRATWGEFPDGKYVRNGSTIISAVHTTGLLFSKKVKSNRGPMRNGHQILIGKKH